RGLASARGWTRPRRLAAAEVGARALEVRDRRRIGVEAHGLREVADRGLELAAERVAHARAGVGGSVVGLDREALLVLPKRFVEMLDVERELAEPEVRAVLARVEAEGFLEPGPGLGGPPGAAQGQAEARQERGVARTRAQRLLEGGDRGRGVAGLEERVAHLGQPVGIAGPEVEATTGLRHGA